MASREYEKTVISRMISIYCRRNHHTALGQLCEECRRLLTYASGRIDRCAMGNAKSSCRKCKIHCYSPAYRGQIREVMKTVGPMMIFVHPVMAIRHLLSEF